MELGSAKCQCHALPQVDPVTSLSLSSATIARRSPWLREFTALLPCRFCSNADKVLLPGASILTGAEETHKHLTWQAVVGTTMTNTAGSGESKVREGLCNHVTSEQGPKQSVQAQGSNIPDRGGRRSQGKISVCVRNRGQAKGASGQARGKGAEVEVGMCRALGSLLHEKGHHGGFGGKEREMPCVLLAAA